MSAQDDIGPALPAAHVVHQHAREVEACARRAADLARPGPRQDLRAAVRQMECIIRLCEFGGGA